MWAVTAAAMGELGELEAEGERIRRSRSCRSSAPYRSRPLLLTAFDTCGRDARDCELPVDSSWIDSTPLSWGRPGAGLTRGVPTTAHPCRCGRRATCTRTGTGTRSLTASSVGYRLCVAASARTRARGARALAPRPWCSRPPPTPRSAPRRVNTERERRRAAVSASRGWMVVGDGGGAAAASCWLLRPRVAPCATACTTALP